MKHLRYKIEPRAVFNWWKTPTKLVYDIYREDEYYDDPSYGNGGGDWYKKWTRIATYDNVIDAICKRDTFNKLESEKYERCSCNLSYQQATNPLDAGKSVA